MERTSIIAPGRAYTVKNVSLIVPFLFFLIVGIAAGAIVAPIFNQYIVAAPFAVQFIVFSPLICQSAMVLSPAFRDWVLTHPWALRLLLIWSALNCCRIGKAGQLLHITVENENVTALKMLINSYCVPNRIAHFGGMTLLHRSMKHCNMKIINILYLKPEVAGDVDDIDDDDRTVLTILLQNMCSTFKVPDEVYYMVRSLLDSGCPVNEPFWNFATAIDKAPLDICKLLLSKGADINSTHRKGYPLLHIAIASGSLEKVKFLIDNNVRKGTWNGMSPFEYSVVTDCGSDVRDAVFGYDTPTNSQLEAIIHNFRLGNDINSSVLSELIQLGIKSGIYDFLESKSELLKENYFGLCPLDFAMKDRAIYEFLQTIYPNTRTNMEKTMKTWYQQRRRWSSKVRDITHSQTTSLTCQELYNSARSHFEIDTVDEVQDIQHCVTQLLHKVSFGLSDMLCYEHLQFIPVLAGSVSENSKVFLPNEYDFVCVLQNTYEHIVIQQGLYSAVHANIGVINPDSAWLGYCKGTPFVDSWTFNRYFLRAVEKVIQEENVTRIGNLYTHKYCFDWNSKIPRLRLKWCGLEFNDLDITVDLVPAIEVQDEFENLKKMVLTKESQTLYVIPKLHHPDDDSCLPISFNSVETDTILNLPQHIAKGFILAKALRIPEICFRGNVEQLKLLEGFHIDDFMKSYILKNVLFILLRQNSFSSATGEEQSYIKWAELIYDTLLSYLRAGVMRPYYTDEKQLTLFECNHSIDIPYSSKRQCCQKRDITLFMCENILKFIRDDPEYTSGDGIIPHMRCCSNGVHCCIRIKSNRNVEMADFMEGQPAIDITAEDGGRNPEHNSFAIRRPFRSNRVEPMTGYGRTEVTVEGCTIL